MRILFVLVIISTIFTSCSNDHIVKDEQLRLDPVADTVTSDTSSYNNIPVNLSLAQLRTYPAEVVLTGMAEHRLVTVYKKRSENREQGFDRYSGSYSYYETDEHSTHYMPGIDLIFGYNLVNVAHYDMKEEKLNYLFEHPVLIKSLYYPSYEQDSLNKKPINRNYYLLSAYDEDTNGDTLINKQDLRRFYYFNVSALQKTQVVPADYSVERSQYDAMNDVMYIFARHDANKNGKADKKEPLHIYWIDLKQPGKGKRLY